MEARKGSPPPELHNPPPPPPAFRAAEIYPGKKILSSELYVIYLLYIMKFAVSIVCKHVCYKMYKKYVRWMVSSARKGKFYFSFLLFLFYFILCICLFIYFTFLLSLQQAKSNNFKHIIFFFLKKTRTKERNSLLSKKHLLEISCSLT